MSVSRTLILLAALCAVTPVVLAQPGLGGQLGRLDDRLSTAQGGYYVNARPGEPTTRVMVWGRVLRPGVYEVGPGFGFEGVIALAGVSRRVAEAPGTPDLHVRLLRPGAGGDEVLVDASLAAVARGDVDAPGLRDGDVIQIEPRPEVRVYVWGAVREPGVYEVGPGFDAQGILSLAGGPLAAPLRNNQRREVRVRIFKAGSGAETPVYDQPLEAFVQGAAPTPALGDGDVIQVETRERDGWATRDTLTAVGLVTSGVIAAVQVLRLIIE